MRLVFVLGALMAWASSASADGFGFRTPSGNIFCNGSVDAGELSCSISVRNGPTPLPRPASCEAGWGHHFLLYQTGKVEMECGRAPRKSTYSDVAEYGISARFGRITCRSERTGFECLNADGHGFFLSRKRQSVF
ncbi:MAG: DUF6636 domain-containing protein [Pseudomonadota bacterium]